MSAMSLPADVTDRLRRPGQRRRGHIRIGWPSWRAWLPSWPIILALAGFARAIASAPALLNDPDTYLHIAVGRWLLEHRSLPLHDPFSHSMPEAVWLPGQWLGEIGLALVYQAAGWPAVAIFTAASFAAALGLLARFLMVRLPPLAAVVGTVAGGALLLPHLLARPHVLALPLLVGWCGALFAARDDERGPPWRALPLMLLWANVHPSFLFGLALAAFFAVEAVLWPGSASLGARRPEALRWGGFVTVAVLAGCVTPLGAEALLQPLRLMAMPALQSGFIEWGPARLWEFPALEFWLLALLVLGFAGVRLPLWRLLLLLALVHMTLAHVRHADLLGLVGPLLLAAAVAGAPWARGLSAPHSAFGRFADVLGSARPAGCVLPLLLAAGLCLPLCGHRWVRDGDAVTPAAAVAAAERLGLTGRVFNSEPYGGYLVFRGVPAFIDGRVEMYGDDFFGRYLAAERGDARALGELLSRYRIGWTLLANGTPAIAVLDGLRGWRRAYSDDQAVIHARVE
jgi:hypothetical protein